MSIAYLGMAVRKARKQHSCFWCRDAIAVGEQFRESRVAEDGRLDTYRLHIECEQAETRAVSYRNPKDDEPSCHEVDIDGGGHERGKNCPECSDMPIHVRAS